MLFLEVVQGFHTILQQFLNIAPYADYRYCTEDLPSFR